MTRGKGRGGGVSGGGSGGGRGGKDIGWEHGTKVESPYGAKYCYVQCKYCPQLITGGIWRFKNHLAHISCGGAKGCPNVPPDVKEKFKNLLKASEQAKNVKRDNAEFLQSKGSYYQGGRKSEEASSMRETHYGGSGGGGASFGHMDRYASEGLQFEDEHGDQVQQERNVTPVNEKDQRNQVCRDISRFFIDNGLAFNVASSPSFMAMLDSVYRYKRPLRPPTPYELSTWILKAEVKSIDDEADKVKRTWPSTGVTLMSDGWKDMRGRQLINFLVNSPEGTIFLKSVDASDAVNDVDMLFKLFDEVIKEVGPENVIQVVTDNASNYKATGKKLMEKYPTLYWTPCAAHCIDLMLGDLFKLPQLTHAYKNAKKITNFIYNHGWVLALMRKHTKRDLFCPDATQFGTAYLTLSSLYSNRRALEQMFTSNTWVYSAWGKSKEGKAVRRIVLKDSNFWPGVVYSLKVLRPLIKVLRLVNADTPSMGYFYGSMDKAKEDIAKNLDNDISKYKEVWAIIDKRWDDQLHHHLHVAAYYLNPQYFYEENFSAHGDVQSGLYACMDKMITDNDEHRQVDLQLDAYREKTGLMGRPLAMDTRHQRTPISWWKAYGSDVPALQKFALRVLGLTCTSSACERNWSTFNHVHTKKRNRLSQSKCNALVYVMYNRRLNKKRLLGKTKNDGDTPDDDALMKDNWESDDEWVAELSDVSGLDHVDPQPCPQWHDVIEHELDEEALIAEMEEAEEGDGGRKRKRKKAPTPSTTMRGRRNVLSSSVRGGGSSSQVTSTTTRDKGKGPLLVDEEDAHLIDVDMEEDEDDSSASNYFLRLQ